MSLARRRSEGSRPESIDRRPSRSAPGLHGNWISSRAWIDLQILLGPCVSRHRNSCQNPRAGPSAIEFHSAVARKKCRKGLGHARRRAKPAVASASVRVQSPGGHWSICRVPGSEKHQRRKSRCVWDGFARVWPSLKSRRSSSDIFESVPPTPKNVAGVVLFHQLQSLSRRFPGTGRTVRQSQPAGFVRRAKAGYDRDRTRIGADAG